jgi:hypothetical protein
MSSNNLWGVQIAISFAEVTSDSIVQDRLASVYDSVDEIDVWVGGLAEDPVNQGLVGQLIFTVVKLQFERLRDGDRFWYERCPKFRLPISKSLRFDRRSIPLGATASTPRKGSGSGFAHSTKS